MSLGLSMLATEVLMTAGAHHCDFQPKFGQRSTQHDTTDPMKVFLAHTMVFVGSIWKSKSGWFLFVMSLELSVATEVLLIAGVHHRYDFLFPTKVWPKINSACHP
jgi:hypothetical protein